MSKRKAAHDAKRDALNALGRELARRSGSKCELCSASGVKLIPLEVAPNPESPTIETTLFACETCTDQIETPKRRDENHWRCLYDAVWSDIPAVQVTAVRMLRSLVDSTDWASDLMDQLYIDPDIEAWIDQASL